MTEDLYQDPITDFISRSEEIVVSDPATVSLFFGLSLPQIVSYINTFALAWCIFYSVLYICNFYFFLVKYPDREVPRMQKGAAAFKNAVLIWAGYLVCLVFFALYVIFRQTFAGGFLGVLAILVYLIKILYFDATRISLFGENIKKIYSSIGESFAGLAKSIASGPEEKKAPKK